MTSLNKALGGKKSLYSLCLVEKPKGTWRSHVISESPRTRRDRTWGPDRSQSLGMLQNQMNTKETLIYNRLTVAGCSGIFTRVITHPFSPMLTPSSLTPKSCKLHLPPTCIPTAPRQGADAVHHQALCS